MKHHPAIPEISNDKADHNDDGRVGLLSAVAELIAQAGRIVMDVYSRVDLGVEHKADASPVTQADQLAEAHILAGLATLTPNVPVVGEESWAGFGVVASQGDEAHLPGTGLLPGGASAGPRSFWLVDPLDGTREFVARRGEFTVNIALIDNGAPVLGAVLAPALPGGAMLYLGAPGIGAWSLQGDGTWQALRVRTPPPQGLTVMGSRSHGDDTAMAAFLQKHVAQHRVAQQLGIGSSLKLCLVAAGQADLYPRLGRTMEWDIAAGHAVVAAAGGRVVDLQGQDLRYGKPGLENPHFVALGAGLDLAGVR